MRILASIALLTFLSACASSAPPTGAHESRNKRVINLQRAAALPWRDDGQCVVREASQPWPVMVERCYQALDHDRIEFHDTTGRCAVASAGAAAVGIGFCVLAAPEIVVGAVIVLGVVVVAVAIKEELDAYELRHLYPEEAGAARGAKRAPRAAMTERKPKLEPEPAGQDWRPPVPPMPVDRTRHASCEPIPVKHRGGDDAHNTCADRIPPNRYPGMDVLVGGKHFDALQVGARVLWEIKTDQFDTYSVFLRDQVIEDQVAEFREDREIARNCGYGFVVGVSSAAHKKALLDLAPDLEPHLVVTECKR
ncbi:MULTISPECIES: DUF6310 domain-containing protein [unclassified Corallococcus]|uniref:DUF6310 domain-containing protein n=1 Tax=unclassified Corallococcus TaxID=2685029 RepID=UPI001A8C38CC|nr:MULTISPECIES: DUF6310 domain-containing protein [unclassified Corallococcus]MBN9682494.1 hypothetical protein [Corallococcus sp. NCSPR001]WAS85954.1 DUF6310 domain-containing protein [Corallococcus sp. NCRR]